MQDALPVLWRHGADPVVVTSAGQQHETGMIVFTGKARLEIPGGPGLYAFPKFPGAARQITAKAETYSTGESGIDLVVCQAEFRHASAMVRRTEI